MMKQGAVGPLLESLERHMSNSDVVENICRVLSYLAASSEENDYPLYCSKRSPSICLEMITLYMSHMSHIESSRTPHHCLPVHKLDPYLSLSLPFLFFKTITGENVVSLYRAGVLQPLLLAMTNHMKNPRVQEHAAAILANLAAIGEMVMRWGAHRGRDVCISL